MKSIKSEVRKIEHILDRQEDLAHNIVAHLDLDVVSGNNPQMYSKLGRDIRELVDLLTQAKQKADEIANYQSYDRVTYNPRQKRRAG